MDCRLTWHLPVDRVLLCYLRKGPWNFNSLVVEQTEIHWSNHCTCVTSMTTVRKGVPMVYFPSLLRHVSFSGCFICVSLLFIRRLSLWVVTNSEVKTEKSLQVDVRTGTRESFQGFFPEKKKKTESDRHQIQWCWFSRKDYVSLPSVLGTKYPKVRGLDF